MIQELSIIIPTLNEEHYLPYLLESLSRQDTPQKLQVIVVDGNSTDRTCDVARQFEHKLKDLIIINTERGVSHQRNRGVEKATYEFIAFIDADMMVEKEFFRKLFRKIDETKPFVVTMLPWNAGNDILDKITLIIFRPIAYVISRFDPLVTGEFILTTKTAHNKINGFTEGVFFGEDMDYGKRLIKNGATYQIFFRPTIYHSVRRARELGRIGLLWHWLKGYIHTKRYGLIRDTKTFHYPFGHYKGSKDNK